jgi:hypothetical protein
MGPIRIAALGCLLLVALLAQTPEQPALSAVVLSGQPLPGVRVEVTSGGIVVLSGDTDANGRLRLAQLPPGHYGLHATKQGFAPIEEPDVDFSRPVELTLAPLAEQHQHVDVTAAADPVEQGSSTSSTVKLDAAKSLPDKPATVSDALPLVPGVVRTPAGDLEISGGGEHRSALIVNSADVTDPATGQFGLTVPIDSVQSLSVFQTPFLAEYGRFTAGLVSVETRRGGDEWKWEINDPFPDFRIYSWRLRGVRDATPRTNVEGPILKNKLYFSEGFEYVVRNIEVRTLPYPENLTRKAGVNSFAQVDWIQSSRNMVTATLHLAPQRLGYVNLDYFNPQPTTPDASTHNYTGTVADRLTLGGGLLENTLSVTRFDARVWGQGPQDLTIAPTGNFGNYFAQQDRDAARTSWTPTYSVAPFSLLGTHAFKIGSYVAQSHDNGQVQDHPINLLDGGGRLFERVTFWGGQPFKMDDTEYAFFGQDHWSISSRFAADLGMRTESQEVSNSFRVAPRIGFAWVPFANTGTVIRAGMGLFYDRVPLNVYSYSHYPKRIVTMYDDAGDISGGPFFFANPLSYVNIHSKFVFNKHTEGDFSPRSATGSIYLEQNVTRVLKLRMGYMQNQVAGLVTMNVLGPDLDTMQGAYQLSGDGTSRYRQFEATTRIRTGENREVFISYVRSRADGVLNDFSNYLGSFPVSVIRPNQFGTLPGDLPNRFLAWTLMKMPHGFQVAPILEYRNGFPYSIVDGTQNYVGMANANRYPHFLSLDSRFSKDVKVSQKYTVRLSLVSYNLTNHFNPVSVHANTADRACGTFFGSRGRRFTADFDVLF